MSTFTSKKLDSKQDAVMMGSDALVDGLNLNLDQLDEHDNEVVNISRAHAQNVMKQKRGSTGDKMDEEPIVSHD